jgi:hypothetical protein
MRLSRAVAFVALFAAVGWSTLPAFADPHAGSMPEHGMQMNGIRGQGGHQSMMSGGMMERCADMMQSMNGEDSRPNSQWQNPPSGLAAPP